MIERTDETLDLYRLMAESAVDCIWLYDLDNQKFKYVSPSVLQLRGRTASEAIQEKLADSMTPESLDIVTQAVDRLAGYSGKEQISQPVRIDEIRQYRKDGSVLPVEVTIRLVADPVTGSKDILGVSRDITGLKKREAQMIAEIESLRHRIAVDEMTGANNRYYFDLRAGEEIERSERYRTQLNLIIFDLDHFKQVNDIWGHETGDKVLIQVAGIVKAMIRKTDILARWGGEEFVLMVPQTDLEGTLALAEKLRLAIAGANFPGVERMTASFGLAQRISGETYDSWFNRADQALYRAKNHGRNCVMTDADDHIPFMQVHLEWKSIWNCGHQVIDQQHRDLLDLANSLIDLSLTDFETENIILKFQQLIESISRHFADEENVLALAGFPDAKHHSDQHRILARKVNRLSKNLAQSEVKPSVFFTFLVEEVIVGHLLTEDVLYFPYIRNLPPVAG